MEKYSVVLYVGRPPLSPYLIVNYIAKLVWRNSLLAGVQELDHYSTVQHLFRSLKDFSITKPAGNGDDTTGSADVSQLDALQSLIVDGMIGVDVGGVSWQDIKSAALQLEVGRVECFVCGIVLLLCVCRPLSSDATCACLLPLTAVEDVPFHIK